MFSIKVRNVKPWEMPNLLMNKIKKICMKLSWYMNSKDIFEFSTFFSLGKIVLESQILSYET